MLTFLSLTPQLWAYYLSCVVHTSKRIEDRLARAKKDAENKSTINSNFQKMNDNLKK